MWWATPKTTIFFYAHKLVNQNISKNGSQTRGIRKSERNRVWDESRGTTGCSQILARSAQTNNLVDQALLGKNRKVHSVRLYSSFFSRYRVSYYNSPIGHGILEMIPSDLFLFRPVLGERPHLPKLLRLLVS